MTQAVGCVDIELKIDDAAFRNQLATLEGAGREMHRVVGAAVLEKVRDHIAQMSVSRHKTANRLGATPTRYFEDAPGRTVLESVSESEAVVAVKNTIGLIRAYKDLDIKPVRKKWLTIPVHRVAYGKSVGQLRDEGHKIFRLGKKNVLAEATGERGKVRPLFALSKHTVVPQDEGLLPQTPELQKTVEEAVDDYKDALLALNS